MFYSEDDMIQQIPTIKDATPFERHACKAMAFGDNLALSATFATLATGLDAVEQKMSEVNENNNLNSNVNSINNSININNIPEAMHAVVDAKAQADALAIALMQSLAPVLQET